MYIYLKSLEMMQSMRIFVLFGRFQQINVRDIPSAVYVHFR